MSSSTEAPYTETTGGRVYTVTGQDWDSILEDAGHDERITVNMGPQHPSTHGVLRLVLEIEGETIIKADPVIGYLHTGIEKSTEYRTWTQAVTFLTRMDYLAPLFNECTYVLGVEKLLGIEIPERARNLRVMLMELNRIGSHLLWIATTGLELGAVTMMLFGWRERELVLDILEETTGLRMNHAYFRPGGLAQDIPDSAIKKLEDFLDYMPTKIKEYRDMLSANPIWIKRTRDVGVLDPTGCMALGITGPVLRSAGIAWDLRKEMPYLGYETYDFDVPVRTEADIYARYEIRMEEMEQSLRIIEQCLDRLEPGPVMVEDRKIGWPAQLALGGDGLGNSLEHVRKIMGTSMEALIHHFKLVTEGFRVPAGQVYTAVESPRGELGCHVVSDGGTRPFRIHMRDPSFANLQAVSAMSEGGYVADIIGAVASIDPVMGGVDR